jgi:flavin reductase (DIM6/NTAB) family NADH-FMN oxidoreductase RutF/rubredoxin
MMNLETFYSLSYGLYIVTAQGKDKKNGYIANTAFQVTAEPPQIAISCNKDNLSAQTIAESGFFGISVLHREASKEIIGRFGYKSGKDIDKFDGTTYFETAEKIPVVTEGCTAWFSCKVVNTFDVGSHLLFIGEVLDGAYIDEEKEPLTYEYYRKARHGRSPKNAPTYIKEEPKPAASEETTTPAVSSGQKWICTVCDHIYDPAEGDPDSGIAPGTPFEALPDDWACPVCGAEKADFEPYEG